MESGGAAINNLLFLAGLVALIALVAVSTVRTGRLLRTWTPPFNPLLSLPENALRLGLIAASVGLGLAFGPGPAALGWQTAHIWRDLARRRLLRCGDGRVLCPGGAGRGESVGAGGLRRPGAPVHPAGHSARAAGGGAGAAAGCMLEELLFRSLPLGGLTWLIAPHWLMWPLAVFFGLLHWPQGGWGVAGTTLAAILLSLLFLATGSIWPPLAAHYVMNGLQVAVAVRAGVRPLRSI